MHELCCDFGYMNIWEYLPHDWRKITHSINNKSARQGIIITQF